MGEKRNDTLVILTADHETGGFGFPTARRIFRPLPKTLPGVAFAGQEFAPNFNFGELSLLDRLYNQQQSFYTLWAEASRNGEHGKPTPASLINAVNNSMDFRITEEQAQRILRRSPNPLLLSWAGHSDLGAQEFPHIHDFSAFYVYGDDVHLNLLARELALSRMWCGVPAPIPPVRCR